MLKRCAILTDGRILLQRDPARNLEAYDANTRDVEPVQSARLVQALNDSGAEAFVVSPNGRWALFGGGKVLVVWNLPTDSQALTLSHPVGSIDVALFSPNSAFALTRGSSELRLWRTSDWTSRALQPQKTRIFSMGFSGDSRRVAMAGGGNFVRVLDLAPERRDIPLQPDPNAGGFLSVALSASGRWLAAGGTDNVIRIWDLETGKRRALLHGHTQGVMSLAFSPDDRTLASSSASRLMLWHMSTWQELMNIDEEIPLLQFSPDGQYLAGLGEPFPKAKFRFVWHGQGGLRLWRAPSLAELAPALQ